MTRGCYRSSPEADTWYSTNVLTQATQQEFFLFRVCCTYSNDCTQVYRIMFDGKFPKHREIPYCTIMTCTLRIGQAQNLTKQQAHKV